MISVIAEMQNNSRCLMHLCYNFNIVSNNKKIHCYSIRIRISKFFHSYLITKKIYLSQLHERSSFLNVLHMFSHNIKNEDFQLTIKLKIKMVNVRITSLLYNVCGIFII